MRKIIPIAKAETLKRVHCFVKPPKTFSIAGCKCGNEETQWSEYERHCWCPECQIDFIPEHNGIFDGPIPVGAAALLGISFDRIVIATREFERYNTQTLQYEKVAI